MHSYICTSTCEH
uniref:Uncharacterized protein n=1 Tax=Arundo donax TaxID=35708 RepID=A0A0A8YCL7_ARUDO